MDKRAVASTGGLLIIFAALLALGGGLRAFDYLINAKDSAVVQGIASVLFHWPLAVLVLLTGIVLTVQANRMQPAEGESSSGEKKTEKAPAPNIAVLATAVFPVDERLQLTGASSPARAAVVRFRNEPGVDKESGAMLVTRALIAVSAPGMNPLHVTGFWITERSAYANFAVGDTHDLLIAIRVNDETSIPDVVASNEDLRSWNVSEATILAVRVQLVGGISATFSRDFSFSVTVKPELSIAQK